MEVPQLFTRFAAVQFLTEAVNGRWPKEVYLIWGQQMLYLAMCFKRSMARGIEQALSSLPPALSVGCALAGNLYDEFGQGIESCCHIERLEKFIQILGGEPYVPALVTTAECVAVHEQLSKRGLAVNLATIWANEVCCPIEFGAVRKGIEQLPGDLPRTELYDYLDVNLGADDQHSQATFKVLRPYLLQEAATLNHVVCDSVRSLARFYDGVLQEVTGKVTV